MFLDPAALVALWTFEIAGSADMHCASGLAVCWRELMSAMFAGIVSKINFSAECKEECYEEY